MVLTWLWLVWLVMSASSAISEEQRRLRIAEDASVGSLVGVIRDESPEQSSGGGPVYILIYPPESRVEQTFAINDHTGEIITKIGLDYETKTNYVFLAIPNGTGSGNGIRVTIEILDVNDCAPEFPQKLVELQLSEYAKIGSETPLPAAIDRDGSERLGVQKYELISGNVNNAFRLGVRRVNRILYADLVVNSELDREILDHYYLEIRATDGGDPHPLTDTLRVNVTILDANDNAPVFDQARYVARLVSNASVGAEVVRVRADDKDLGDNGVVDYRLLPSPLDAQKWFYIDGSTGKITLAQSAQQLQSHRQFELFVSARDRGFPQPLEATAFVTVNVVDSDEHKPEIKMIYMSDDGRPIISEGAEVGSLVARVSVSDPDTQKQFRNKSNVSVEGDEETFGIKESSDAVYVFLKKRLDRETKTNYSLTVVAGVGGVTSRRSVLIKVADVNDNAPQFKKIYYEAEIREKSTPGTSVARVEAVDADEGENGAIVYSLAPSTAPYAKWLDIDPETGLVTTADNIDCEISSKPEYTVVATDHGKPALFATAKLTLTVLDVNDNPPSFAQSIYNVSVREDADVGYCFLKVQAFDPDCGVNAQMEYRLSSDTSTVSYPFQVDKNSGNVCSSGKLDYEHRHHYQFPVLAYDGGGLFGSTMVVLAVEDVNDNAPLFDPTLYNVTVRQSASPGTFLMMVAARDADDGQFGTVTYNIAHGNEAGQFRIDRDSGEIYVDHGLSTTTHHLAVQATDGGGLTSLHPALVTVVVSPDDYSCPQFDQKLYRFTVREDTLPGIVIGTVRAHSPVESAITYSIYSGDPLGNVSIDPQSGSVSIVHYLDHETQQQMVLNIQASTDHPPSVNYTQVRVIIEDVNDNPPVFESKIVRISVPEDQALQKAIFVCMASDRDGGKNGEVRYRLISNPDNAFMVHPVSGEVRLTQALDYEHQKNYTLRILTQDTGVPPLSDNMTLEIVVMDVNDHDPRFAVSHYLAVISEDALPMTPVLQLRATDEDSGVNGQITYRLETTSAGDQSPFRVFADTGWIYVRQMLDREVKREYTLRAVAKDNGQPSRSAAVSVVIQVGDVNDHAPSCFSIQNVSISENRPAGTLVGRITADDPDEGENGTVAYSVTSAASNSNFRLDANGQLYTGVVLDRETEPYYDLSVVASDQGHPPLSSICSIRITVLDENDQAPVFVLPIHDRIYVREEQPKGSEVVQIRASDGDNGENGTVKYNLEQTNGISPPFNIDPVTGVLTSTQIFDYENGPRQFQVTVVAEDLGRPPRSSRKTLAVEIVDVDDGGEVSNDTVTFRVSELASVGFKLGHVDSKRSLTETDVIELRDADTIAFSYEIVSGNNQGIFDIDRLTSSLYLMRKLDYETSSVHFLVVNKISESKYSPSPVIGEIRVKVSVVDENDNTPTFDQDPIVFSVPENKAGFVVWQYNATDGDTGSFGRVEYEIVEQYPNEPGAFQLNSISGELLLKRELDYERVSEYLLLIEATDQAPNITQRRSGRVTTRIYVTDVNDCYPKFVSRDQISIFTDEPIGYPVMYMAADDADGLENGRVTYRIASGNEDDQFQLNSSSGALSLLKPLKRDYGQKEHRLTIVAEDHGLPQRTMSQILTVQVQSVDDALHFDQSIYRVNVTENGPAGVVVAQLRAHGPNGGEGQELLYILLNGTVGDKFRLNEKTGSLTTNGPLDREEAEEYVLTVYVRESLGSPRYDVATVIVTVDDVNDNEPKISEATCRELAILENQPFATFHTIVASDLDAGPNGRLSFTISGGNVDGKFKINAETGEVGCDALDRETTPVYNLTVQVRDDGSASLTVQCSLAIHVLDENDNTPRFEQASYLAQVQENAPVGTTVVKIRAIDLDEGLNGQVMYTIANETAGLFDIGANTGEIVVLGKLDYEQGSVYSFVVKAYDQGPTESRWDTVRVTIQIMDVNDNAPMFANVPFIANVSSTIPAGQRVVKVVASDADGPGPNSEVSYSLSNTGDNRFVINPSTGVISAKQDLHLTPSAVEYLNVVATDHGEPPKSTTSVVEIVVDLTDNSQRPNGIKFSQSAYRTQVSEDAAAGAKVVSLEASSSTAASPIEYKIISGNELGIFNIDPSKGTIMIADPAHLDFETIRVHQLIVEASAKVKATSSAPDFQHAYVAVRMDVLDANDHVPQFLQQRYSAAVLEGKPKGTFVIQVSATDGDTGENAALTYSIVSGNVDSAFVVDNAGVVKTNVELDREIHGRYTLTVMAVDTGTPPKSGTASIDVLVMDVNDNSPSFPTVRPIKISEGSDIGSLLTTMTANDVDTFPPLVYSLGPKSKNASEYFSLDRSTGRLVLARSLDYETIREFDLEIQASDGVYVATASQTIIVQDENDNTPQFAQSFYQAVLPSAASAGSLVTRVSAIDRDSGANGQVKYTFVGSAQDGMGFNIDPRNGDIFLNRSIDARSRLPPLIQLSVAAVDNGQPPRSTLTTVLIQIGFTSDESVDFSSKSYRFSAVEDAPIHSVIGRVATTMGSVTSKHLHYVITRGDSNRTFSIDSQGNIVLMKHLDREHMDSYNLDITVGLHANSATNSSARVYVEVEDVNDNVPVFVDPQHHITVQEYLLPGAVIAKLNAIDPDAGANGAVTYQLLSGDAENAVNIDQQTGALSLHRSTSELDENELNLIVIAHDGGSPSRHAISNVIIHLQKDNASAPFFPLERYFGWIPENAPVGTMLVKMKAATKSTLKLTNSSIFTYSIMTGNEKGQFQLVGANGQLRTSTVLDYEERTFYRLAVVVSDGSGRWANTTAHILVRGVDEYSPEFIQNQFVFQISYDAVEGEIVGTVQATDKDGGIDGKVGYMIKEESRYFKMDPTSGTVSVAGSLADLKEEDKPQGDSGRSASTKGIKRIFLTVLAYSGPDAATGKVNSTSVEIQIGHFSNGAVGKLGSTGTIVSISVALILLLIFILISVMIKLRRRDNKPNFVHAMAAAKRGARNRKNRQLIKASDVVQPCPRAASRAAGGFFSSTGVGALKTATSSGRGSLLDENDGRSRFTPSQSSNSTGGIQKGARSGESGIHVHGDDAGSFTSELPSTREYLTSLGVEASITAPIIETGGAVGRRGGNCEDALGSQREEDPADVQDLIYSKVSEVLADQSDGVPAQPCRSGRRSPLNDSLDYYVRTGGMRSPRTSWAAPIPTAPSYQPLTQVFSEIAKIKNDQDTLRRRQAQAPPVPNSLRVNGSEDYGGEGLTDTSPGVWVPTDFASPDEPDSGNAYAVSEPVHSRGDPIANGEHNRLERTSDTELEIKI